MKKISFLLFAVMMAGSLSAQIEEVSAEQYAPKKEVKEKTSLDYLPLANYPADLLDIPYNLIGQQLYCTQDHINGYSIVALTISPDESIGIMKLAKGAYYTVTNVICNRYNMYGDGKSKDAQLATFRNKIIKSENYINDTLHYVEKDKEKIYTLSKAKEEDVSKLLSVRPIRMEEIAMNVLYELTDADGIKYYIGFVEERSAITSRSEKCFFCQTYDITVAMTPSIGDFISVNTFNYLKAKYEKKEVVAPGYYDPCAYGPCDKDQIMLDKHVIYVEKVGVENGKIVFVMNDPSYSDIMVRQYKTEKQGNATRHQTDTIWGVSVDGYWCALPLRTEADSLLNKWHQEEQAKEAIARAEKAKQKAELTKKYGAKYAQYIIDGKVCVGMTKEMCQKAMGKPNNTARNKSALGDVEVWTYSTWYPLVPIRVVTFYENKVTSVEEYTDNYPF